MRNGGNVNLRNLVFISFQLKRIGKLNHSAIQDHPAVLRLKHVRWLVVS